MPPLASPAVRWLSLLVFVVLLSGCSQPRDLHQEEAGVEEPTAAESSGPSEEPAEEPAEDAWKRNRIAWTTASEVDNFGYDIYRGDVEEGPFERITEQPLPGHGTTDEPSSYEFFDDTIEAGTIYWYYVESIALDGERERFTPIFPSKPKYAPGTEPAEEPATDEPATEDPAADAG